jgi:hypothetical protein
MKSTSLTGMSPRMLVSFADAFVGPVHRPTSLCEVRPLAASVCRRLSSLSHPRRRAPAATDKRSTLGHRNVFVRAGSSRVAHIDIYFVLCSPSPASTVYVSRLALPMGGPPRTPLRGGGARTTFRSWAGRLHGGVSQLTRIRPAGLSVAARLAAGPWGADASPLAPTPPE